MYSLCAAPIESYHKEETQTVQNVKNLQPDLGSPQNL
jgi:hypothetical protein